MSNFVFVIDRDKTPLKPTHPAKARQLIARGLAAVYRRYPFTIILKRKVENVNPNKLQLKIDPGAKTTGISLLSNNLVIWAAQLTHRGEQIKLRLADRRVIRRSRRNRKTRYRKPRFLNRLRPDGWLPPSLEHRILTSLTWVKRLIKLCPIGLITQELVRFDTQKLVNPEISGIEYQQGTLYQYEVRQYLLEKFNRSCVYCGTTNVPLEVEHIVPRSRGGSNRVSNVSVIAGKNAGLKNVRIKTVRTKGNFDVRRPNKTVASVSRNHIIPVHRKDGYSYSFAEL